MRNYLDARRDRQDAAHQFGVTTDVIVFVQMELKTTFRKIESGRKELSVNALRNMAIKSFMNAMRDVYRIDELHKMYSLTNHAANMIHRMVDGKSVELFY